MLFALLQRAFLKLLGVEQKIDHLVAESDAQSRKLNAQAAQLQKILEAVTAGETASVSFDVVLAGKFLSGVTHLTVRDDQQFTITPVAKDKKGNPSSLDHTKTTYAIDNPALATLTPNPADSTCLVVLQGVGSGQIQATFADANDPADVVKGVLHVDVVGGATATVELQTSAPVAQV